MAVNVENAYPKNRTQENLAFISRLEFGLKLEGKILIIYKTLYGLKSSSAGFHEHLFVTPGK